MTYGRRMKKAMAIFDPLTLKIGTSLLLIAKVARNDQMTFLFALITHAWNISMQPLSFCA